jgi:hypothetical protein
MLRSLQAEEMTMRGHYDPTLDPAGYANCVLESGDDYEPYGYAVPSPSTPEPLQPMLQTAMFDTSPNTPSFDRVIEAQILSHSSMVGC